MKIFVQREKGVREIIVEFPLAALIDYSFSPSYSYRCLHDNRQIVSVPCSVYLEGRFRYIRLKYIAAIIPAVYDMIKSVTVFDSCFSRHNNEVSLI